MEELQDYIEKAQDIKVTDSEPLGTRLVRRIGKKRYFILGLIILGLISVVGIAIGTRGLLYAIPAMLVAIITEYQNWDKLYSRKTELNDTEREYYRKVRVPIWNLTLPGLGTLRAGRTRLGYIQLSIFTASMLFGIVFSRDKESVLYGLALLSFFVAVGVWGWALGVGVAIQRKARREMEGQKLSEYTRAQLSVADSFWKGAKETLNFALIAFVVLAVFLIGLFIVDRIS